MSENDQSQEPAGQAAGTGESVGAGSCCGVSNCCTDTEQSLDPAVTVIEAKTSAGCGCVDEPGGDSTLPVVVTRAPSFSQAPVRCLLLEPGGSRGDGLVRSPVDGLDDTAAPGSRGAADRQQGDAP